MTAWSGNEVYSNLKLESDHTDTFKSLCGLAYRNNPKRAHLIVSNVLGKHVPQTPQWIDNAAYVLSVKTLAALNGKNSNFNIDHWIIGKNLASIKPMKNRDEHDLIVFGYAETATNLGALIAEHLNADYFHSTRYGDEKIDAYGSFSEDHSHAASHEVRVKNKKLINNGNKTIILVDDELTTGNTIMNTIKMFEKQCHHKQYIIATLTDLRDEQAVKNIKHFSDKYNIKIKIVSLLKMHLTVPPNSLGVAMERIKEITDLSHHEEFSNLHANTTMVRIKDKYPILYYGVNDTELLSINNIAKKMYDKLTFKHASRILVLGNEEDMYMPFKLAQLIENYGHNVKYSTTTLSPVIPYDSDDYAIKNRIVYHQDSIKKYAYNITKGFDHIIFVCRSKEHRESLNDLFGELQKVCNELTIIELER